MEKHFVFDFSQINNLDEFYREFKEKMNLYDFFGANLDALHDVVTGFLELPLSIEFINMNLLQLDEFSDILEYFEDIQEELTDFQFSYFLEIYDDEDSDFEWDD